jgi:hypothetical protein
VGKSVLGTLQASSPSGLKPSEGDTPAAGICMEPQDQYVAIALGLDQSGMPLAGRCIVLLPSQRIKLINQSDQPIAIQFADYYFDLPVGNAILLDNPVGEYLASGVHYLPIGPALWLKAAEPIATMPGPLSYLLSQQCGAIPGLFEHQPGSPHTRPDHKLLHPKYPRCSQGRYDLQWSARG